MEKVLKYLTKDKLLVNMIVIIVTIFGIIVSQNIKREVFPPTDINKMIITVNYPGASPSDVELNAVVPIEDELKEINGIEEYTSISVENSSKIIISLDQDLKDSQVVKDEIFRKITLSNLTDVSDDVEDILVVDLNPALKPVYNISISPKKGKKVKEKELYAISDLLKDMLYRVEGVSEVTISGYLDREIHINVDPSKMQEYYISLSDIVSSIKSRNIRSSGGTIQSVHDEKNILTIGQFENPMDVGEVIIRSGFEQKRVRVKDIASIVDTFEDSDTKIRVNQENAVTLNIKKKENADIITTVDNIKKFLEENKNLYKDKFNIDVVEDESKSISSLIDVVFSNAVLGFILVLVVLFIFLDFKTSFWTAFSIPFCMFLVLIFMNAVDFSLNILTLGAIITVLGMMVDDAIVIAEIIYEKKKEGMNSFDAAIEGVKEVAGAVVVTITSTIVAFLPMLMIKGTMGKFISVYPIVITATLIFSLLEAIFILPNHLVSGKDDKKKKRSDWFKPVAELYKRFLKNALRFRYLVLVIFIITLFVTLIMSSNTIKGFVLFWDDSTEEITVDIDLPGGTALEETEVRVTEIEKLINKNIPSSELVSIYTTIGSHSGHFSISQENWAQIQVKLVPVAQRDRIASDIVKDLRSKINTKTVKGFNEIIFRESKMGPPTGEPVDIKVIGQNVDSAKKASMALENFLKTIPGVKDISNDQTKGKDELRLVFNYEKMAQYGINVETIAQTVRIAYEGTDATSIQTLASQLDFKVQIGDKYRKNENFLMSLLIPNDGSRLIKLKDIASLKISDGQSSINHYNGYRAIGVTADVDESKITPMIVINKVKDKFKDISQKYQGVYLIYGGEVKESGTALSGLGIAFLMALVLIYVIVVILFRSFSQPFIVLSVIPFGIIGVLIAFNAHGVPLSFMALIGIIGLSGVVINDSIIMVEYVNNVFKRSGDADKRGIMEKISEGAKLRLRPIILTTVTTVAGLMPTIYGIGGDAKTLVPTVMAMAYGLLFATLLTLIFVPCLYMINVDIKELFLKLKIKISG